MTTISPANLQSVDLIEGALRASGATVRATKTNQWLLEFPDRCPITTERSAGFLVITAAMDLGLRTGDWGLRTAQLLEASAQWPGFVKCCRTAGEGLQLRAEIPLCADSDLSSRVGEATAAMGWGLGTGDWGLGIGGYGGGCVAEGSATPAFPSVDLLDLCAAAQWPGSPVGNQTCQVQLDTLRGTFTARVNAENGAVRVWSEIADWESLSSRSCQALSRLMLDANAALRFARGVIVNEEEGGSARLEVFFSTPPSPQELASALEALSIGVDLCAREMAAVCSSRTARSFLALRGGPRDGARNQPQQQERT